MSVTVHLAMNVNRFTCNMNKAVLTRLNRYVVYGWPLFTLLSNEVFLSSPNLMSSCFI